MKWDLAIARRRLWGRIRTRGTFYRDFKHKIIINVINVSIYTIINEIFKLFLKLGKKMISIIYRGRGILYIAIDGIDPGCIWG